MKLGDGYMVVVSLQPKPLPSLGLEKRYTRIDYTSTCIMRDVLESMARVLTLDSTDLTLEDEGGIGICLKETLADYYNEQLKSSSVAGGVWPQRPSNFKRHRKQIDLRVRHTPPLDQLVTCIVGVEEDSEAIRSTTAARRTTIQLPNTAAFGELLELARSQREESLGMDNPVYGRAGELDISLRDAWVREGCRIDYRFHVGRAVLIKCDNGGSERDSDTLSFVMGVDDTIGDVKKGICQEKGIAMSRQSIMIPGAVQGLENHVTLSDCGVAGASMGSSSPQGWGELHLELRVKEAVFPVHSCLETKSPGERRAAQMMPRSRKFFPISEHSAGGNNQLTRHMEKIKTVGGWSPEQSPCPPSPSGSDIFERSPVKMEETPTEAKVPESMVSPCQTTNASRALVFFALSPSGRALVLRLRRDARIVDAKKIITLDEGVPSCLQRLLWRGHALEPDHASLYALGVRSGDTLILGYRIPQSPSTIITPMDNSMSNLEKIALSKSEHKDGVGEERVVNGELALSEKYPMGTSAAETVETGGGAAVANVVNRYAVDVDEDGDYHGALPASGSGERENTPREVTRRGWPFSKTRGRGVTRLCYREYSGSGLVLSPAGISPSPSVPANRRVIPACAVVPGASSASTSSGRTAVPEPNGASGRSRSMPSDGRVKASGWARWKQGCRLPAPASTSPREA